MDANHIAARIKCNLTWFAAVGSEAPFSQAKPPPDVWPQIKALWNKPDEDFISSVHVVLLGRPIDPASLSDIRTMLAPGAPRGALVRRLALCGEAQARGLDVAWLPRLDALEGDAVWRRIQEIWQSSDRAFVDGLYPALLGRPADESGASALCRALAGGMSRKAAARLLILSAESRDCGMNASLLLPRLNAQEANDVWRRVLTLWGTPDRVFVEALYPTLLGRRADAASVRVWCVVLAAGAPRASLVRRLALSEEARIYGLDVTWLPGVDELEGDAVWLRVQRLWLAPDKSFITGLFCVILSRCPTAREKSALCAALAAGSRRAVVARDLAESKEARGYGLSAPWLPLLDALPSRAASRDRSFSFNSLKYAFRRWLAGWKVTIPAPRSEAGLKPDVVGQDALEAVIR